MLRRVSIAPEGFDPGTYYDGIRNNLTRLEQEVHFSLEQAINARHIKTHSISGRVKDRRSYLEKIERKAYEDPLSQVEDLVGIRAVCLFSSDLPPLDDVVKQTFDVLSEEDKVEQGSVDTFGYMSVHYVARIHPSNTGARYDGLKDLKFEVQCRTILMDAWANVSHYLAYKGASSVPKDLQRDFYALAGLFYVADKHFELFFGESTRATMETVGAVASGEQAAVLTLDRDTVAGVLAAQYPGREQPDSETASELTEELAAAGYRSVAELGRDLRAFHVAALAYEVDHPPLGPYGKKYVAVGIARQAIAIANKTFRALKYGVGPGYKFQEYEHLAVEPGAPA